MLDTNITKSTTFHPQTDDQTEVVNRMIVHILRMYNSKNPCTWDESLPYVFNVDRLHPYFPPLLDTFDIVEQLTPTELKQYYME